MNEISINDEYGYNNYKYLNEVLAKGLEIENVSNALVSVVLTDEENIHVLNRTYRNVDKPTDVLSFAIEEDEEIAYNNVRLLGDIFISIPIMKKQALEYGHSEKRELAFLAVHGLLHLLGYDHMNKEEEKIMLYKQELILNGSNIKR